VRELLLMALISTNYRALVMLSLILDILKGSCERPPLQLPAVGRDSGIETAFLSKGSQDNLYSKVNRPWAGRPRIRNSTSKGQVTHSSLERQFNLQFNEHRVEEDAVFYGMKQTEPEASHSFYLVPS
jgi:hypothetical protein